MANSEQSDFDLTAVNSFKKRLLARTFAENTVIGYESDWQHFVRWCVAAGQQHTPTTSETLCFYVTHLLSDGFRVTTAERRMSAILHHHRANKLIPPSTKEAREVLNAGRRYQRGQSQAKAALRPEHLKEIMARNTGSDPVTLRNRALLLVGFVTALRRSELVNVQVGQITEDERGVVIFLPYSKRDQTGKGRYIGCFKGSDPETCPVAALKEWLAIRGSDAGPVFCRTRRGKIFPLEGLRPPNVNLILKAAVELIGLDTSVFGAHSLRAGFVTAAGRKGTSPMVIMRTTGHTDVKTVQRYFRMDEALEVNPLKGVL